MENLSNLFQRIATIRLLELSLLLVDDNSPDGTAKKALELRGRFNYKIDVIKRRGKYGLNSSASAYPKERQIYLEEVWTEGANGGFGKKVARTKGVILFESEISYIEFLK